MTYARKSGLVCYIRVSTLDAMAVADLVRRTDQFTPGMNFSAACAAALQTLLEWARANQVIPTRDGFDYAAVMEDFSNKRNSLGKNALAAERLQIPEHKERPPEVLVLDRAKMVFNALWVKGKSNWTNEDLITYETAFKMLHPETTIEYPA